MIIIKVKRKCDGEAGVIKNARGTSSGLRWVDVIFERNLPIARNVDISHFKILSVEYDNYE